MRHKSKKHKDSGVAAVELAILIPIFVLLIGGILEFGHAWYIKQAITSASRDGARHGILYRTVPGTTTRCNPCTQISPSIKEVIDESLEHLNETYSITCDQELPLITGNELTVTVTADKTWFLFKGLGIGMDDTITISATTKMKLE